MPGARTPPPGDHGDLVVPARPSPGRSARAGRSSERGGGRRCAAVRRRSIARRTRRTKSSAIPCGVRCVRGPQNRPFRPLVGTHGTHLDGRLFSRSSHGVTRRRSRSPLHGCTRRTRFRWRTGTLVCWNRTWVRFLPSPAIRIAAKKRKFDERGHAPAAEALGRRRPAPIRARGGTNLRSFAQGYNL